MIRVGRIALAGLSLLCFGLGLLAPASAGWTFEPAASAVVGYDSNIQRVGLDQIAGATSRLAADLQGAHEGRRHNFGAQYRPVFEMFPDNRDLNNLSHLLRLDWRFTGSRSEFHLDGSAARTEDPRYVAVGPTTPVPDGAPFLTERTRVDTTGLGIGGTVNMTRNTAFVWSGAWRNTRYDSATLLDSSSSGANLRVDWAAGSRVSWGAGYRYDRFDAAEREQTTEPSAGSSRRETAEVHALDGQGSFQLTPAVDLAINLSMVVSVSGDVRGGGSPWFGGLALGGDHRRLGWSVEYRRAYSAGGGASVALVNQLAGGTLAWTVTAKDSLSLAATRTFSEDASATGTGSDTSTDSLSLRYERSVARRWSLVLASQYLAQHGDESNGSDDFQQERITLGVTYSMGRKT